MTDVAFHTGLAEPVDYACRLLRKASRSGARVAVRGEAGLLERLDQALWTFEPLEFIPHLLLPRADADAARLAPTPVVLLRPGAPMPPGYPVGVSLGGAEVPELAALERLVVLVGHDEPQREAGRRLWRACEAAGHTVSHVARGG